MYMLTFDLAFIEWSAVLLDNFIFSWNTILDGVTLFSGHLSNMGSGAWSDNKFYMKLL